MPASPGPAGQALRNGRQQVVGYGAGGQPQHGDSDAAGWPGSGEWQPEQAVQAQKRPVAPGGPHRQVGVQDCLPRRVAAGTARPRPRWRAAAAGATLWIRDSSRTRDATYRVSAARRQLIRTAGEMPLPAGHIPGAASAPGIKIESVTAALRQIGSMHDTPPGVWSDRTTAGPLTRIAPPGRRPPS
jgi:hypothetical protein